MTKAQQKKTEKALFDLINKSGSNLRISFNTDDTHPYQFNNKFSCAASWRDCSYVIILLAEPRSKKDLKQWDEAIIKATRFLKEMKEEQEYELKKSEEEYKYELKNPNFFERVKTKHNYIKP